MKKIILVVLIVFVNCSCLFALDSLSIVLKFRDNQNIYSKNLLIGIHKDATHAIDTGLGEQMLPEMPPPGDIYSILFITDSSDMSRYHSYIDFRPIPEEDYFVRHYRFKLFNLSSGYTISWSNVKNMVDSAFLLDIVNGSLVNVSMIEKDSFYVENWGMDQFNVVVYYDKNLVNINEKDNFNVKDNIIVYPNPVISELKFITDENKRRYMLINSLGLKVLSGETGEEMTTLDMTPYPNGIYFLGVEDIYGNLTYKKFMKY